MTFRFTESISKAKIKIKSVKIISLKWICLFHENFMFTHLNLKIALINSIVLIFLFPFRRSYVVSKCATKSNVRLYNHIRGFPVVKGDVGALSPEVRAFIDQSVLLCQPESIHICDGSNREYSMLLRLLQIQGTITPLPKYKNCWLARLMLLVLNQRHSFV